MRVLTVYNAYLNRGGEDEVFDAEAELLSERGHEVLRLRVEANDLRDPSPMKKARLATQTIWSSKYYRLFQHMLNERRPNIVHVHNVFPLISPAALIACQQKSIPVVHTLHNFRMVSPGALLYRDGKPCEDSLRSYSRWPCVMHGCYHESRSETAIIAAMLTVHRIRGTWRNDIDRYIALTEFSRRKFIEGGLPREKIAVKPNFIGVEAIDTELPRNAFLAVGRLAPQKGTPTLLKAWSFVGSAAVLKIVGDGPDAEYVQRASEIDSSIRAQGRMSREAVLAQMRDAQALIFPSEWYEGFPLTIAEAFACGTPVIASRLGAMAEIVEDGVTGLLFEPGNADDLAAKVRWAHAHPAEMRQMGDNARREYEAKYTPERNYEMLMDIYEQAIEHAKQRHR